MVDTFAVFNDAHRVAERDGDADKLLGPVLLEARHHAGLPWNSHYLDHLKPSVIKFKFKLCIVSLQKSVLGATQHEHIGNVQIAT